MLLAIVGLVSPASSIPTPRFHRVWRLETVGEEPGQWVPLRTPAMGMPTRKWFASSPPAIWLKAAGPRKRPQP